MTAAVTAAATATSTGNHGGAKKVFWAIRVWKIKLLDFVWPIRVFKGSYYFVWGNTYLKKEATRRRRRAATGVGKGQYSLYRAEVRTTQAQALFGEHVYK